MTKVTGDDLDKFMTHVSNIGKGKGNQIMGDSVV